MARCVAAQHSRRAVEALVTRAEDDGAARNITERLRPLTSFSAVQSSPAAKSVERLGHICRPGRGTIDIMQRMKEKEIVEFVKARCEAIAGPAGDAAYRCGAHLKDGLTLPCVLIAQKTAWVQLALRRFQETKKDGNGLFRKKRFGQGFDYASIVESFVTAGNRLNSYDIDRLVISPFAIPLERLREVKGETSMSWTQFVGVMSDGQEFSFGTTFLTEFFQMPDGYVASDIVGIRSHARGEGQLFRERPYFTCFVEGL